ncbi:MAG: hypothetical protein WCB12_16790, partial [Bryobacteraceae bacterium]
SLDIGDGQNHMAHLRVSRRVIDGHDFSTLSANSLQRKSPNPHVSIVGGVSRALSFANRPVDRLAKLLNPAS